MRFWRLALVVRPQRLIPKRWDMSAHKINRLVERFDPTDGYHPSESIHKVSLSLAG
jgi:hypothetical protein